MNRHKISCHAPGVQCLGCPHYFGNADRCTFHEPREIPKPVDDFLVIRAMQGTGGSFVKSLAECCRHCDPHNLKRIKDAFPDVWDKYSKVAICMESEEANRRDLNP